MHDIRRIRDDGAAFDAALARRGLPAVAETILARDAARSEEHTSELQSLMRRSYDVFCLKKKTHLEIRLLLEHKINTSTTHNTETTVVPQIHHQCSNHTHQ